MLLTIGEALERAATRLASSPAGASRARANPSTPRAEAEELLGRLLGLARPELYLDSDRELAPEEQGELERWLERRLDGEPVQYITGRAAFRGLDLAVRPSVLIPRPETEVLVESVLEVLRAERGRWPAPRVLDLGTGSGAIALAIADEWPAAAVTATDVAPEALEVARANASALEMSGRVMFLQGDWFDPLGADDPFEVVVSNPPYVAGAERTRLPEEVRDHEPPHALLSGASGLEALRRIIDEAPRHLVARGLLALEVAEMRAAQTAAMLEGSRDWDEVRLRDDLAGRPRVLLARRAMGPAIAPAQWGEQP